MAKIKLTESVSISELKHMREVEGLSNAEIAKRVGCAVSTVIAYIGKQTVEMTKRNQMAGLRKTKDLPPLTETKTEIPDMPRESFRERCERLMAKEVETNKEVKRMTPAEPLTVSTEDAIATPEQVVPLSRLEDLALEAYMKHEKEQKERVTEIIPELVEVFGQQMVRHFLKVNLYFCGIPYCYELKREVMLEALKKLNSKEDPMYD